MQAAWDTAVQDTASGRRQGAQKVRMHQDGVRPLRGILVGENRRTVGFDRTIARATDIAFLRKQEPIPRRLAARPNGSSLSRPRNTRESFALPLLPMESRFRGNDGREGHRPHKVSGALVLLRRAPQSKGRRLSKNLS